MHRIGMWIIILFLIHQKIRELNHISGHNSDEISNFWSRMIDCEKSSCRTHKSSLSKYNQQEKFENANSLQHSEHQTDLATIGTSWASLSSLLTLGYLEFLGQPSIATIILCPSRAEACLVSIRIRGILRSAGVNKCRLAYCRTVERTAFVTWRKIACYQS